MTPGPARTLLKLEISATNLSLVTLPGNHAHTAPTSPDSTHHNLQHEDPQSAFTGNAMSKVLAVILK